MKVSTREVREKGGYLVGMLVIILTSACVSPGRLPTPDSGLWGKDGFDLNETKTYMNDICGYGDVTNQHGYLQYQQCMVDGGFSYLDGRHDEELINDGFLPVSKHRRWCLNPTNISYDEPGCISFRNNQNE